MAKIRSVAGIEAEMQGRALKGLLDLLIEQGLPRERAAQYCLGLASEVRYLDVAPNLLRYTDAIARRYEDIANLFLGEDLIPRHPET